MDDSHIKKIMEQGSRKVQPSIWFRFRMRRRLHKKSRLLITEASREYLGYGPSRFKAALVLGMILVVASTGLGTYAYASPEIDETNLLYPVKEGLENFEYQITPNPSDKAQVRLKHAMRRMDEMRRLSFRFRNGEDGNTEDAMQKTIEHFQTNIQDSFDAVPEEDEPENAEKFVVEFHQDLNEIHDQFENIEADIAPENLENMTLPPPPLRTPLPAGIKLSLKETHSQLKQKILNVENVTSNVHDSSLQMPHHRVFLRRLLRNEDSQLMFHERPSFQPMNPTTQMGF